MMDTQANETTPDQLMEHFQGRSLKSIIAFTIIAHAVLLLGTSVPFLWRAVFGDDSSGMSEDERVELAMKEATASLREIAEQHGLKPQDLSSQLAGGAPRPAREAAPRNTATPETGDSGEPAEPKSEIERELDKKATGPAVPPIPDDEEEDLFK